jgi:hypothetical protein
MSARCVARGEPSLCLVAVGDPIEHRVNRLGELGCLVRRRTGRTKSDAQAVRTELIDLRGDRAQRRRHPSRQCVPDAQADPDDDDQLTPHQARAEGRSVPAAAEHSRCIEHRYAATGVPVAVVTAELIGIERDDHDREEADDRADHQRREHPAAQCESHQSGSPKR